MKAVQQERKPTTPSVAQKCRRQTSVRTREVITKLRSTVMSHPQYNLDLTASDFHSFFQWQMPFVTKVFCGDVDVEGTSGDIPLSPGDLKPRK
jgi:hypothetical protein